MTETEVYEAFQTWPAPLAREVARHLRDGRPRTAVFLGCAGGLNDALPFAELAPEIRVLASDVDPDFLAALARRAAGRANVEVRRVDVSADLDALEPAELVTAFFVLHRVERWEEVVPPLARLVAPGGRLHVSEFAGPDGLIRLANEGGGSGRDPVSRLLRRHRELRPAPFAPRLRSSDMRPCLDLLGRVLAYEGHRDFAWPQRLSVADVLRRMELGAHAPFARSGVPMELLRAEFAGELDGAAELVETIRVHRFAKGRVN